MRKLLALLITISLVFPLLLASQMVVSTASWVLDRQFYIDMLDNEQVYQLLLSDEVLENVLHNYLSIPTGADTQNLKIILRDIIAEDYLADQVGALVNDFFDYIQGKTTDFEPVLDILPIKTALTAEKQDEFLRALVAVMPVCAPGETPGFGGEGATSCKPQNMSDEVLVENLLKPALPQILAQLPDELPLDEQWRRWEDQQQWRRFLPGMALPAGLILSVLVLAFITFCLWYITALIAGSSWRARLQWLGWTLIIPSGLTFLTGLLLQGSMPLFWLRTGLARISMRGLPIALTSPESMRLLLEPVVSRITLSFLVVGGICAGLALGLILWGMLTPRKID